jgi:phage baseplate assembly protein gpV
VPNLNDIGRWIEDLKREIARLKSGAFLESASITDGRLRIIGGTLRVDSGGLVDIVGTLQVDGTTNVTGTFGVSGPTTVTGTFQVSGPWKLTGTGEITGNYTVTGKVTQVGDMDINGVLKLNGNGWSITGDGEIAGTVNLTGSFEVATGGYIQVGPVRISGAAEGFISSLLAIVFNTPELRVDGSVRIDQTLVVDGQINAANLIPISVDDVEGSFPGAIMRDASGNLRYVVG